jgi:hypothetical protein
VILVIAEQRGGRLNRATWETIAAVQPLGQPVVVAVPGSRVSDVASELAAADVQEVVTVHHPLLELYTPDAYVAALTQVIAHLSRHWSHCLTRIRHAISRPSWPPGWIARSSPMSSRCKRSTAPLSARARCFKAN